MNKNRTLITASLLIAISLLASGCGPANPAGLSNEQVLTLTADILSAMEEGDYDNFSSDFSSEMMEVFTEEQFTELGDLLQTTSGTFVSCGEMNLSNKQGYALYRILCTYEVEDVVVTIVFQVDGTQVEGLFFDSPNLRAASE